MNEQQLNDELTKILNDDLTGRLAEAFGEVTIEVNGMDSHIKGQMNRPGALMIAHAAIKSLEVKGFSKSFEESIVLLDALKSVINSEITEK